MSNFKKGISLVVLIITIIVLIILTGAVILTINQGDIFGKSKEAVFKSDMSNFQEELRNNILNSQAKFELRNKNEVNAIQFDAQGNGTGIKDWIPSATEEYRNELKIVNGELRYIGEDVNKTAWATQMNMYDGEGGGEDTSQQVAIATYEEIKLGDYVEYTSEGQASVTVEEKTVVKENLNWRVLKKDGTNVTLISETPTTGTITFSGKEDWANAPTILNTVCQQLYSKAGVGTARSINVEDVNSITGFDGNNEINWKYYNKGNGLASVPEGVRTIGQIETHDESNLEYRQTPGESLESYLSNYYYYKANLILSDSSIGYKLIFRNVSNTDNAQVYWLSSSCILAHLGNEYAYFYVRYVKNGFVSIPENSTFRSDGTVNSTAYAIRPLVVLDSMVQVNITEGRDGTTAEKAWKIQ